MKKTQSADLFSTIKKTLVSFISIVLFITCGMSIYVGFDWTDKALRSTAHRKFEEGKLHDAEIYFPYGLCETDIEKIRSIEGVDEVEAQYYSYELIDYYGALMQAKLVSITENQDLIINVEGRLPENANEIAVDNYAGEELGVKIGEKIKLYNKNAKNAYLVNGLKLNETDKIKNLFEDGISPYFMDAEELIVTGIVTSAEYFSKSAASYGVSYTNELQVDMVFFINYDRFNPEIVSDYNSLLIRSDALRSYESFSDDYREASDALAASLRETADEITERNRQILLDNIDGLISEYRQSFSEASEELSKLKSEIEDGENQISEAEVSIQGMEEQIAEDEALLSQKKAILDSLQSEIEKLSLRLSENKTKDDKLSAQIESLKQTHNESLKEYYRCQEEALSKKVNYSYTIAAIKEGSASLAEAKKSFEEAENEYELALKNFVSIEESLSSFPEASAIIFSRTENAAFIYNKLEFEAVGKIKYILGGLFLIIGILVSYSAVTRIVNDHKRLIGTKKALGLTRAEITLTYLFYNGLAFIIGSILGILLAYFVVERILVPTITQTYSYKVIGNYFDFKTVGILVLTEFIFIEAVTLLGCSRVLKQSAVKLLEGSVIKSTKVRFYEKSKFWKKLPLLSKTIVTGTVNDPKRVFATLIGIAGATALIVSSITLKDNVLESYDRQYRDYYHFDSVILYDNEIPGAAEEIRELLDLYNVSYCDIYFTGGYTYTEGTKKLLSRLIVYEDTDAFNKLVTLEASGSSDYSPGGAWYPESIQNHYGTENVSTLNFETYSGDTVTTSVSGFYRLYSYNLMCFMDSETYISASGKSPKNNAFLVSFRNTEKKLITHELIKTDGYTQTYEYSLLDMLDAEVYRLIAIAVVGVYSFVAVLMSVFVLLDLLVTYVNEKKAELIVLMINGYSLFKARRYISMDTIVLAVIGIILGVFGGIYSGSLAIKAFESEYICLMNTPDIKALITGVFSTAFLSFLMAEIAMRRIGNFKLTEINDL